MSKIVQEIEIYFSSTLNSNLEERIEYTLVKFAHYYFNSGENIFGYMPNSSYRACSTYVMATTFSDYAFWVVRVEEDSASKGFIHLIASSNASLFTLSYVGDYFLNFTATTAAGGDLTFMS